MTYRVVKYVKTGNGLKERLHVKAFKHGQDVGEFLSKQSDNSWREIAPQSQTYLGTPYPTKSGIYACAGGQWHNVKKLDASILAHI